MLVSFTKGQSSFPCKQAQNTSRASLPDPASQDGIKKTPICCPARSGALPSCDTLKAAPAERRSGSCEVSSATSWPWEEAANCVFSAQEKVAMVITKIATTKEERVFTALNDHERRDRLF